jgi:hypothetical protein
MPPPAPATPLSASAREKLANLPALFDGRTLGGWIQEPIAPVTFGAGDIVDLPAFAARLADKSDPMAAFVVGQLDEPARAALAAPGASTTNARPLASALAKNLTRIAGGPSIFDSDRFRGVKLRTETEALRARTPRGSELRRLNRMLLEDAFPRELLTSPTVSWIVKDGAMASTGAGRGVIYTGQDYTRYRLVFQLRHVSGRPDHQPCILIFCTRPPADEPGLDALGGIQFQAPNGGHWDYRPGHNNAGTAFVNPIKAKFDNHEWCQVELLVDARRGTARMAVAQPVGTKAVENLVFQDAAAGKTGPIAWQMHNAGLFDEFKDVRLEVDPTEDRLITVE